MRLQIHRDSDHSSVWNTALGVVCLLAGPFATYLMLDMTREWWHMRWWVQVDATLVRTDLIVHRGARTRTTDTLAVKYNYAYKGRQYSGTRFGLGQTLSRDEGPNVALARQLKPGQRLEAWVNPRDPADAVLLRDFGWRWALFLFLGAHVALSSAYFLFRPAQKVATGPMIAPLPRRWTLCLLTVVWNITVWPLLSVALAGGAYAGFWLALLMILMAFAGQCLAWYTWSVFHRRWKLHWPMLEYVREGTTLSTARIHFDPPFHARAGEPDANHARLTARQVVYVKEGNKERLKDEWTGPMGSVCLQSGDRSADFSAALPDWPVGGARRPAYWDLDLQIAGTTFTYRLMH